MIEISLEPTQVASVYLGGDKKVRDIIKAALGDRFGEVLPIKERVTSFEDAYNELGEDHQYCVEYRAIKYGYISTLSPDLLAYAKLRVITAALNEGWKPEFTEDETRYYPWFQLYNADDIENMSEDKMEDLKMRCVGYNHVNDSFCGIAYIHSVGNFSPSTAHCGSHLVLKSEELAEYAAKQFTDLYSDYLFKPGVKESNK